MSDKQALEAHIKPFDELSAAEVYEIIKARFNVFYLEQQIRYPDLDDVDYQATHLWLSNQKQVVAYARLFADAEPGVLHIGRMLTTERSRGYGRMLMQSIIDEARRQGATTLRLHAQTQAVPFYQRLGFHTVGETFLEADIPHIEMRLEL
jgi:ElaA protein